MSDIAHPSAPTCAVKRCEICHSSPVFLSKYCNDCFNRLYTRSDAKTFVKPCLMCDLAPGSLAGYCRMCTDTINTSIATRIQNRVVADKPLEPCEICHTNPIVSSRYCQECFDKHKSVQVLTEQISNVTMDDEWYECDGCGGDRTESRCGHCDMMEDSDDGYEGDCCGGNDPKCPGCHPEIEAEQAESTAVPICDVCNTSMCPESLSGCECDRLKITVVPAPVPCLHCDGWSNGSKCWCRAGMRSDYCCQRCETCIDDHKASPCGICHEIVSCGGDGMCWPCFDKCVAKTAPLISHIMGEPKSE